MAILLFFLLGIGLIVLAGFTLPLGLDWWAGLIIIAGGIGCICRALYLLHDETGCFDGFLKKLGNVFKKFGDWLEDRRTLKERREKQEKMNMVELFNYAWDNKNKLSTAKMEESVRNLLSHAYVEFVDVYEKDCKSRGEKYDDEIFYALQLVLVNLIKCSDEELTAKEYESYVKFCDYARIKPLTRSDVDALYKRSSVEVLAKDIQTLVRLRSKIMPKKYEAFVVGLCFLSVIDGKVDENEYYIIRCFFEKGFDVWPNTWAQFKIEWK